MEAQQALFNLAIQTNDLKSAYRHAHQCPTEENWKKLLDVSIQQRKWTFAQDCEVQIKGLC